MTRTERASYAVLLAASCIAIGLIWDIAWHRSVGRDTFWTAPHLVEYLAAIIVGVSCGSLILRSSFGANPPERDAMVRFWGFRGPLGAWVCVWGSLTMLASAPFDNWWHNAYGLDVRIVSPPHMVLGAGMCGIVVGAMLMALAEQNRAGDRDSRGFTLVFALASAILLLTVVTITLEFTGFPNLWRGRVFYQVSAAIFPLILAAVVRAGRLRWPATATAALFMLCSLLLSWILQSVPATAKLAPITNPITHLVVQPFPILLIAPAVVFDLLSRKVGDRKDWRLATLLGVCFVLAFLAVSWPAAAFFLSPAARNGVFLADQWDYSAQLGPWRYEFWDAISEGGVARAGGGSLLKPLLIAMLLGAVASRIGLALGSWMRKVRR